MPALNPLLTSWDHFWRDFFEWCLYFQTLAYPSLLSTDTHVLPFGPVTCPYAIFTPPLSGASERSQLCCTVSSAAATALRYCHASPCLVIYGTFRLLNFVLTLNQSRALDLWNLYKSDSSKSAHSFAHPVNFSSIYRTMTYLVSPMIKVLVPFKFCLLLLC